MMHDMYPSCYTYAMEFATHILIIILATFGFFLAWYIRHHKVHDKVMVCMLDSDCHKVVHSDYSTLFWIPLEFWGMWYYGITVVAHSALLFAPHMASDFLIATLLLLTLIAFLFSMYLTSLQAFVLKEWCTWCLISATLCTLIFILAASTSPLSLAELTRVFLEAFR